MPPSPAITTAAAPAHVGRAVAVHTFVHALRDQKRMQFLSLRDRSGLLQAVHERAADPALADVLSRLPRESAVRAEGTVESSPQAPGGVELRLSGLTCLGPSEPVLPIDAASSVEARMDWRFLDLRRPEARLIFDVQSTAEWAMRDFWRREGFLEIHTPKLMGSPSESGAELFALPYFGRTAYLAQSPQFYKQMAMAAGFERVFEIAPVFRANPSFTSRHDTEFTSVDVEVSWVRSHEDVMCLEEAWLVHILDAIARQHGPAIQGSFGVDVVVPSLPFPRIPLSEAIDAIAALGHRPGPAGDLDPEGERLLARQVRGRSGHDFVFVTDYPVSVRPFYHMRHPHDPGLTRSFDLLWRGLEITTGAQREHRLDILTRQAGEKGLSTSGIRFYLDFFRYGCPPHGGYGFGLTRFLMVLLGLPAVRDATFLVRTPNRLIP